MWGLTGKIDDRSEPMNENELYNYTKYRKLISEASIDGINITYDRNGSGLREFDRISRQDLRSYGKMPTRGLNIPAAADIPVSGPFFNRVPQNPKSDTINVKIGDVPVKEMFNYAFLAAFYVNPNIKKKEDITNEDLIRILTKGILPTLYEFNNANGYPKPQTVYMVRMMCSEIDKALGYTDMRISKKYTYCVAFCIDPAYSYEQVQALYDSCGWIIPFFWVQRFDPAPYNESAFPYNPFIMGNNINEGVLNKIKDVHKNKVSEEDKENFKTAGLALVKKDSTKLKKAATAAVNKLPATYKKLCKPTLRYDNKLVDAKNQPYIEVIVVETYQWKLSDEDRKKWNSIYKGIIDDIKKSVPKYYTMEDATFNDGGESFIYCNLYMKDMPK